MKMLHDAMEDIDDDDTNTNNCKCDGCSCGRIRGDLYVCLECENFELCASCFERRIEPKNHKTGHLLVHLRLPNEIFGQPIARDELNLKRLVEIYAAESHDDVTCDGCETKNFVGLRFKCDVCNQYDLCQKCAENQVTTKDHQTTHPLILTSSKTITQIPLDDIELSEALGRGAFGDIA